MCKSCTSDRASKAQSTQRIASTQESTVPLPKPSKPSKSSANRSRSSQSETEKAEKADALALASLTPRRTAPLHATVRAATTSSTSAQRSGPDGSARSIYCSLCEQPVRGAALFCMRCEHATHWTHGQLWFAEHTECATGCGCACTDFMS